ncbi:MAG: hypothetical protein WA020_11410 [Candidatus Acidiferrales bacterium]
MKQAHCVFEEKIVEASRTGQWSDALLAHLADCRACEEVALVAGYLCESAEPSRVDAPLPDAGRIWWRAQVAAKAEAIEKAMRPILWARRFAFGACAAVIVAAIVMGWSSIGAFFTGFAGSLAHRNAPASSAQDGSLLLLTAAFFVILLPLVFGLYAAWSED